MGRIGRPALSWNRAWRHSDNVCMIDTLKVSALYHDFMKALRLGVETPETERIVVPAPVPLETPVPVLVPGPAPQPGVPIPAAPTPT